MTPREEVQKTADLKKTADLELPLWSETEGYEFGRYWHFVAFYETNQRPAPHISIILERFLSGMEDDLNAAWLTWKLNGEVDGRHPKDYEKRI